MICALFVRNGVCGMRIMPVNQNYQNNSSKSNKLGMRNSDKQNFGIIIKNNFDKVVSKNADGVQEKILAVISAPSGTGKDTILHGFNEKFGFFKKVTTCTTRNPRPGEIDGRDYHFLSVDEFKKQVEQGEFLEFENVYADTFYGTRRKDAEQVLSEGHNAVLVIDVNGAKKIKEIRPKTVSIFITPPSLEELAKRLIGRGTETPEMIEKRLARADYELSQKDSFDVILQNDDVDKTVKEMAQIVHLVD